MKNKALINYTASAEKHTSSPGLLSRRLNRKHRERRIPGDEVGFSALENFCDRSRLLRGGFFLEQGYNNIHKIYNQSVGYRFAIYTARYTTKLQNIFERSSLYR